MKKKWPKSRGYLSIQLWKASPRRAASTELKGDAQVVSDISLFRRMKTLRVKDSTSAWEVSTWHSTLSIAKYGLPWTEVEWEHLLLSNDSIRGKYCMFHHWKRSNLLKTTSFNALNPDQICIFKRAIIHLVLRHLKCSNSVRTAFDNHAISAVTNHCNVTSLPGHSLDCWVHTGRFHDNGLWMVHWTSDFISGEKWKSSHFPLEY